MKCPDCGHDLTELGGDQPGPLLPPTNLYCSHCNKRWNPQELPCQHEPANFSTADAIYRAATGDMKSGVVPTMDIQIPYLVCRLCGVFYTDIDAIRAGEKKYQEAQGIVDQARNGAGD